MRLDAIQFIQQERPAGGVGEIPVPRVINDGAVHTLRNGGAEGHAAIVAERATRRHAVIGQDDEIGVGLIHAAQTVELANIVINPLERVQSAARLMAAAVGDFVVTVEGNIDRRNAAIDIERNAEGHDLTQHDIGQHIQDGLDELEPDAKARRDPGRNRFDHVAGQFPGGQPDHTQDAPRQQHQNQRPPDAPQMLEKALTPHRRQGEQGEPGAAVHHVRVAGAARQDAGPAIGNPIPDALDVSRVLADRRKAGFLLIPAKGGHIPVVAIHDAGLDNRGAAGQPTAPSSEAVALLDQTVDVRREAARQRLLQVRMRQPINLYGDEAGSPTFLRTYGAT